MPPRPWRRSTPFLPRSRPTSAHASIWRADRTGWRLAADARSIAHSSSAWERATSLLRPSRSTARVVARSRRPPLEVLSTIARRLVGNAVPGPVDTILFQIRLPRVLAALLIGAALAAAGASYQTLFRNPLVSPDILG